VTRRPSKRQQEKAPESRDPNHEPVSDEEGESHYEHVDKPSSHHSINGHGAEGGPAPVEGQSRFQEQL
jgi:hypothetical protein